MKLYLGKSIGSQPPHIFAIADRMYRLLVSQGESQATPSHPHKPLANPLLQAPYHDVLSIRNFSSLLHVISVSTWHHIDLAHHSVPQI